MAAASLSIQDVLADLSYLSSSSSGSGSSVHPVLSLGRSFSSSDAAASAAPQSSVTDLRAQLRLLDGSDQAGSAALTSARHVQLAQAFLEQAKAALSLDRADVPARGAREDASAAAGGTSRVELLHARVARMQARAEEHEKGLRAALEVLNARGEDEGTK